MPRLTTLRDVTDVQIEDDWLILIDGPRDRGYRVPLTDEVIEIMSRALAVHVRTRRRTIEKLERALAGESK